MLFLPSNITDYIKLEKKLSELHYRHILSVWLLALVFFIVEELILLMFNKTYKIDV